MEKLNGDENTATLNVLRFCDPTEKLSEDENKRQLDAKQKRRELAKKRIAEHKKEKVNNSNSDCLSQDEIDELLNGIGEVKAELEKHTKKIKIYDFSLPDKFSKEQIRNYSVIMESVARAMTQFILDEYNISAKIKMHNVDQLTMHEFIRTIPLFSAFCSFEWFDGYGFFQMDPKAFYTIFLNSKEDIKRDLNRLEQKIFHEYLYNLVEKIITEQIENYAGVKLDLPNNQKIQNNPHFCLMNGINTNDMGILVSFKIQTENTESLISLFLNADVIDHIEKMKTQNFARKGNFFPLSYPPENTIAEVGRFRLEDNFQLEEKMIFELNKHSNEALAVYKNGKYVGQGDAVVIDEHFGVRITTNPNKLQVPAENDFYNTKVILGGCITDNSQKLKEGAILEFNERWNDLAKIVKDGKVIAYGEIVVIDFDYFTVRVKKVCE